ncbi:hypothetical protein ABIE69_003222 [Rhodobacteraceae bacterium MBR-64]|jgi:hypothetical protein
MHYDCEFSGHRDGSAFEANAPLEFQPPCPQIAVGKAAGQNDRCRLIEKACLIVPLASGERWSRKFGPVVKVDRMTRETIRNGEEKDTYA